MLEMMMLLVRCWHLAQHPSDNQGSASPGAMAPLIPFLKRIEALQSEFFEPEGLPVIEDDWDDDVNVSATRVFLKYLRYPASEDAPIDLQQAVVVVMAHLERLASPFQPKQDFNTVSSVS